MRIEAIRRGESKAHDLLLIVENEADSELLDKLGALGTPVTGETRYDGRYYLLIQPARAGERQFHNPILRRDLRT